MGCVQPGSTPVSSISVEEWAEYEIRKLGGVVAVSITASGAVLLLEPSASAGAISHAASGILGAAGLKLPVQVLGGVSGPVAAFAAAAKRPALVATVASAAVLTLASSVAALTGGLPFFSKGHPQNVAQPVKAPASAPARNGLANTIILTPVAPAVPPAAPPTPVAAAIVLTVAHPAGKTPLPAPLAPLVNLLPQVTVPTVPSLPKVVAPLPNLTSPVVPVVSKKAPKDSDGDEAGEESDSETKVKAKSESESSDKTKQTSDDREHASHRSDDGADHRHGAESG
jgi:hypothetical protein